MSSANQPNAGGLALAAHIEAWRAAKLSDRGQGYARHLVHGMR